MRKLYGTTETLGQAQGDNANEGSHASTHRETHPHHMTNAEIRKLKAAAQRLARIIRESIAHMRSPSGVYDG